MFDDSVFGLKVIMTIFALLEPIKNNLLFASMNILKHHKLILFAIQLFNLLFKCNIKIWIYVNQQQTRILMLLLKKHNFL